MRIGRGSLVVLLTIMTGCTSPAHGTNRSAATGSTPSGPTPAATPSTSAVGPEGGAFVRPCDTSVYGDLGPGWQRRSIVAGPIAFVGLGSEGVIGAGALHPGPAGFTTLKVLAVVATRTRVRVSVRSPVHRVALLYDAADFHAHTIAGGERAVVFPACRGGATPFGGRPGMQFNGGFLVRGRACARLVVRWDDRRRTIPLALGRGC
jgi:hypothetical protein